MIAEKYNLTLISTDAVGEVRDRDWMCLTYQCRIQRGDRRQVWAGPYHLGIGRVPQEALKKYLSPYGGTVEQLLRDPPRGGVRWAKHMYPDVVAIYARVATRAKIKPKLEDLLSSLLLDGSAFFDAQRFEDWCADFGYSDDSIKALDTWRACDATGRQLAQAFTKQEIEELREWSREQ
jgi:hypothetical protein